MPHDRKQNQRFEMKYRINEDTALLVRDFARVYLDFDEHCVDKENFSYPVHSVYLDSDDLKLYRAAVNKTRYKLRLRYYDTNPDTPVFFEIKRWLARCILKQRGCVHHEYVESLLKDQRPQPEQLVSKEPNNLIALQNFCDLAREIQAKPKVHVCYRREAYVSDDNQCRITLDRKLHCDAHLDYSIPTDTTAPRLSFSGQVILELKFTNRFPDWFRELIRVFGIIEWEGEGGKYRDAVQAIGL